MYLSNYRIKNLSIAGLMIAASLTGFSTDAAVNGSSVSTGIRPDKAPDETQRLLQERGYGMFIHFGMNTFIEREWSEGVEPASTYNPTELDCDQWVRVARDAGFRYVLLVTKHHDGFCLWNSGLTDYDVASSGNTTDVVGAVAEACRKYGLKFGVYYSLWDRHEPTYTGKNFNSYVDFMCGQLTELLTNYGDVCELWLDGAWDKPASDWDIPRLYNLVKKYQPNCAFAVNGTIGTSEDDKGGFVEVLPDRMTDDDIFHMRYFPGDVRLWDPKIASRYDHKQYLYGGNSYYLPFEHTICISKEWNWFQKKQPRSVRDIDELEELFYWTTSNGNTLVINIPPDRRGKIMEHEAQCAIALRQRLGIESGKPLPTGGKYLDLEATATSQWDSSGEYSPQRACDGGMQTRWAAKELTPSIEFTLNPDESFDKITIFEYCDVEQLGDFSNRRINRIQKFNIECEKDGSWETIYVSDTPIGDCLTIRLPYSMSVDKIRMNVTSSTAPPSLYEFSVIDTRSEPVYPVVRKPSLRSAEGVSLSMPYSDMALSGSFVGAAVSDKDWYIWCFSPLMCPDGKVHAFCSRWPAAEGMEGWIG